MHRQSKIRGKSRFPKAIQPIARVKVPRVDRLKRKLITCDTETTGTDFYHGCRPFYVSVCTSLDETYEWEWRVDPHTRQPKIPNQDISRLTKLFSDPEALYVFQNSKFDIRALSSIGVVPPPWALVEDTLIASHLLFSNESHDLKDMALRYLGIDDSDEVELKEAITEARKIGKSLGWSIAKKGHPCFPAVSKAEWWKLDMWLLVEVAEHFNYPLNHPWRTLCRKYGMNDSIRTLGLWLAFREELTSEGLWPQYRERMNVVKPVYKCETNGLTVNAKQLDLTLTDYNNRKVLEESKAKLLAPGLENLKSSEQLKKLFYKDWKLPVLHTSKKTGAPSCSREALDKLELKLDPKKHATQLEFIKTLRAYRILSTSCNYLDGYKRGGFKIKGTDGAWLRLHTDINITGPRTTRFSTSNPSQQNVSKRKGFNLRSLFGPIPGREWYSIDQSNVEMRLFAYCSGDRKLIEAFESGKAVHLIFAEILYPREFEQCLKDGVSFKDRYETTYYQWIKNGNFALIYGAAETKANATYRVPGAYNLIRKHLPLVDEFIRSKYNEGLSQGYVELLGGYRLQVPRTDPHKAANYFIQGSAGWSIQVAMNRIDKFLTPIPRYKMVLQVHDELVFDFPVANPGVNENIIRHIASIMEQSGDDFGIPMPVEINRHTESWAVKEHVQLATAT